ncbi:MAG: bifunctional diaminohydroxyphosphoribosylaminopyrimidine deaminase/5-amino-6-(5-phosphoribosylamino)uracil reductase RibD [Bacteroidota bacterium]
MNNGVDLKFIERCFELAKRGEGFVSPNPLVGALIVRDGKILSEGYHKKYGGAHAEVNAIHSANEDLSGTTLYCNLEPCCHANKQTPPCVPLIIKSGIKRVVVSNLDPNPFVNGKGIEQLKETGINVKHGILSEEGKELNRFYFKSAGTNFPYVTVKIAQSIDGFINSIRKERTRITSDEAEIFVHHQRAKYDAVLVGANTIKIDNPKLTVRRIEGRNPFRIIVDGKLSSNPDANVFNDGLENMTWLFTSKLSDRLKKNFFMQKGIRVFEMDSDLEMRLEPQSILAALQKNKINSVFVEGGAQIFSLFIKKKLFDELIILQAPIKIGEGIKVFDTILPEHLKLISIEQLGTDEKRVYRKID